MSKPTNNELKNLLNNKTQNLDNFEQDAIEGFDSLENHDEAFDLKLELDKEINDKLFNEEETSKKGIIWFAAAGLILTLGLGILFVKSDLFKPEQKENLALNEKEEIKVAEKAPEVELNEDINTNKQAEVLSDLKTDTKTIEAKKYTPNEIEKPVQYVQDKEKISSTVTSESYKVADDATLDREEQKGDKDKITTSELNDVIEATPKNSVSDEFAKEQDSEKLAKKKSILEFKNKNKDITKREEEVKEKFDKNASDVAYNTNNNSAPRSNSSVSTTNSGSVKSNNQKGAPAINEPGVGVTKSTSVENINLAQNSDKKPVVEITCGYKGGEKFLNEELKNELVKLNLNKAFKAKLVLNENLSVKEVTFIDRTNFDKKEIKKLKQIILALNKFDKPMGNLQNSILTSYINYQP